MMTKDNDGYIISKLPEDAYFLPDLPKLVIPVKNGFPEYTPDAYNASNRFFRTLGYACDIDNLNDKEWNELTAEFEHKEIVGLCKIAFQNEDESIANKIISDATSKLGLSDENTYIKQLQELTVLDICIKTAKSFIHIELPYCTIDKM